jgi:DNA-binding Xre family transcriptional regulator
MPVLRPRKASQHVNRLTLLHGPYSAPRVRKGDTLFCEIRGTVKVSGWTDGPIAWPWTHVSGGNGRGGGGRAIILCGDLVRAVRSEAVVAISHHWGVSATAVGNWRRALKVEPFNEWTRAVWRYWRPRQLPQGAGGPLVELDRRKLQRLRQKLGVSMQRICDRCGWTCPNSYGQLESGLRKRVTVRTLRRLARAMECQPSEICRDD